MLLACHSASVMHLPNHKIYKRELEIDVILGLTNHDSLTEGNKIFTLEGNNSDTHSGKRRYESLLP